MTLVVGVMASRSGPTLAAELEADSSLRVIRISSPDQVAAHAGDLEVLIASNDVYLENVAQAISVAPHLRWLQIVSSGYDNVTRNGVPENIIVTRGGPSHAPAVAEHAVMLLLALVRRLPHYERTRLAHRWDRDGLRKSIGTLEGATAVIVGFGAVGREIAKRLRPFGVHVIGVKQHVSEDAAPAERMVAAEDMASVFPEADAVILSLPLTPQTAGLIGPRELRLMKPTAFVVNVARGEVLDSDALLRAVTTGQIAGAALDVFAEEPLSAQSPLWDCPDIIISPHVAGAGGSEGTKRTIELVTENLARYRDGRPLLNPIPGLLPSTRKGTVS